MTIYLNIKRTDSTLLGHRYGDDGTSGEENPYTYNYNLKVFTPTEFNTFSGYQPRQVIALRVYQPFGYNPCPRKAGLPDVAGSPRTVYWIPHILTSSKTKPPH